MNRQIRCGKFLIVICLIAIVFLPSCSVKKNRAATRNYHAFVTRYNILYNGENRYREAVDDMIATFKDNDSTILSPHPADMMAGVNSSRFDYSIDKARKAILHHSITSRPRGKAGHSRDPKYQKWMSRKEYNPALGDAWLLLGNCYFMKGRFDDAALVFATAELRFGHDSKIVEFCRIMQARCRADMGWNYEAEMMLERVNEETLEKKQSKYLYYSTRSIVDANKGDNSRAAESALKGVKYAPNRILAERLMQRATQLSLLPSEHEKETLYNDDFLPSDTAIQKVTPDENREEYVVAIIEDEPKEVLPFTFARTTPHEVVFSFDANMMDINKLLYEIACYNFEKFDTVDYDINRIGEKLSVGKFDNYDDAQSYIKMFVESNHDLMNLIRLTPVSTTDLELMTANGVTIETYLRARAEAWSINEIN